MNDELPLNYLSEVHPANPFRLPDSAKDCPTSEGTSPSNSASSHTPPVQDGLFGKTCQESCPRKTTLLDASSLDSLGQILRFCPSVTGAGGPARALPLDQDTVPPGVFSTLNISEWPNAAAVCSLSQVLETTCIQQKYYLSAKACAGILRRAEKRGKKLPAQLEEALKAVVSEPPTSTTAEPS